MLRYVHSAARIPDCRIPASVAHALVRDGNKLCWPYPEFVSCEVPLLCRAACNVLEAFYHTAGNLTSGFIDYGLRDLTGGASIKFKWTDKPTAVRVLHWHSSCTFVPLCLPFICSSMSTLVLCEPSVSLPFFLSLSLSYLPTASLARSRWLSQGSCSICL